MPTRLFVVFISAATALRLPAQPPARSGRREFLSAAAAASTGLAALAAPAQAGLEYTRIECTREDTECLQRKRELAKAALFQPKVETAEERKANIAKANSECGPLTCGTALAIKCDRDDLECLANKRKTAQEGVDTRLVVALPVILAGAAAKNAKDKDNPELKAAFAQQDAERQFYIKKVKEARAKGLEPPTAFEVNLMPDSPRAKLNKK